MSKGKSANSSPEIVNRRARHEYIVSDTLEVGIALLGSEVKSVRAGRVSLAEGYVRAESAPLSLTLHGVNIDPYAHAAAGGGHAPKRARTLLAHKREIEKLARESAQKGVTIVPLKMYFKDGRAKLLIGVAKGKGASDKRQDMRKREAERDIHRALSRRR